VDRSELTLTSIGLDGNEIDQLILSPLKQMTVRHVLSVGDYTPDIAAGSLISISGTNLAIKNAEGAGFPLPTKLGGVEVRVAGRALPLLSVSAAQIRAQLPYDISGPARLEVSGEHGYATADITVATTAPSVLAIHTHGAPFSSLNPARPGRELALYLTGLGKPVIAPVDVWIGDTRIQPSFAGLVPGKAGTYRVDISIPHDLKDGVYAVRVVAGGVSSRPVNLDVLSSGTGDRNDRARSRIQTWNAG
jgi:uncharacterized protein (TIGR03437 family)